MQKSHTPLMFLAVLLVALAGVGRAGLFCNNCDHTFLRKGDVITSHTMAYSSARKLPHIPLEQMSPPDCPTHMEKWYDENFGHRKPTKSDYSDPLTMFRRGTNHTLGQQLLGTNLRVSPMFMKTLIDIPWQNGCTVLTSPATCEALLRMNEYKLVSTWMLDGVPSFYTPRERRLAHFNPENETSAKMFEDDMRREQLGEKDQFEVGFPVVPTDQFSTSSVYVWSHYHQRVYYQEENDGIAIVGYEVVPMNPRAMLCDRHDAYQVSYSVRWIKSKLTWNSRAQVYLFHRDRVASLQVDAILGGLVAMMLLVGMSYSWTRQKINSEEKQELDVSAPFAGGWRAMGGDVLRAPPWSEFWSAIVGVGAQYLATVLTVALSAMLFSFYVGSEASIVEVAVTSSCVFFLLNGFITVVAHRNINRDTRSIIEEGVKQERTITTIDHWLKAAYPALYSYTLAMVSLLIPFMVIERILKDAGSTAFIGYDNVVKGMAVWAVGGLLFHGNGLVLGWYASRKVRRLPMQIKNIPGAVRTSAQRRWKMVTLGWGVAMVCYVVGGFVTGAVLQSIWGMHVYAMYGAFVITGLMFLIISATGTCVFAFQLIRWEDYRWWWRAPFVGAMSSVFFFFSCIFYVVVWSTIENKHAIMLLITESAIVCLAMFFLLFCVCAFSGFAFVNFLYGVVKQTQE